jgi:hypothetical protein
MIPFDVLLTVCSMWTGVCSDVVIGKWAERMPTPYECAKYGQIEAEKWLSANPGYKLAKFGCGRHSEAA